MSTPYLSEIRIFSFNFAPKGWAMCNGQFLPINQNQALFALLGTTYGGNGQTTFALPNLRGRVPIHMSSDYNMGQQGGSVAHTLTVNELPAHTHLINASTEQPNGNSGVPPAFNSTTLGYTTDFANITAMAPQAVSNTGGGQAHNNMQPYLVLNFCIALQGVFPSQN